MRRTPMKRGALLVATALLTTACSGRDDGTESYSTAPNTVATTAASATSTTDTPTTTTEVPTSTIDPGAIDWTITAQPSPGQKIGRAHV